MTFLAAICLPSWPINRRRKPRRRSGIPRGRARPSVAGMAVEKSFKVPPPVIRLLHARPWGRRPIRNSESAQPGNAGDEKANRAWTSETFSSSVRRDRQSSDARLDRFGAIQIRSGRSCAPAFPGTGARTEAANNAWCDA